MRVLLVVALLLVSASARAEWVRVGASKQSGVYYVDPATIKKDGHLRRAWGLTDLRVPDKDGDRSLLAYWEVDCKEMRLHTLQEEYFRGPMATGERTGGTKIPSPWAHVAPGTVGEDVQRFVCDE